ncbi:MAG: pyridoxamine 5'-phosphate oxidase family protein [Candidatus Levybacteria bacterium]|nr:pyridoxamine 5'-phosphate oxidase family protein [Candidatus Levybacteria bacterium]
MDLKKLIKEYMAKTRVMQLATCVNNRPWVCSIHFYADDQLNIYWISAPTRRHSEDIQQNAKVAATMNIHEDTAQEPYVIGLTAEGEATVLTDKEVERIGKQYIEKLSKDRSMLEDILSGKINRKFYRLKVTKFVLFDTNIFPADPRQELKV